MGCAENHRAGRESKKRSCHMNETIFSAPQRIEGEDVARATAKKPPKKMKNRVFFRKKRIKNLP
jgi:hypothetical protein